MSEKKKYLLILSAFVQCEIHSAEKTKEVQIECEPGELMREIEREKKEYDSHWQNYVWKVNSERDEDTSESLVTTTVKQVLPL